MSSISDLKKEIFGDLKAKKEENQNDSKNQFNDELDKKINNEVYSEFDNQVNNQLEEKIFDYDNDLDEIYIDRLQSFGENPFKLCNQDDLQELAESIKDEGLLNPIILWKKENTYTILSGHNRIEALKMLGHSKLKKDMYKIKENISLDDARLIVVDTNLVQRREILPSERAKAYSIQQKVLCNKDTNRSVKTLFIDALNTGETAEQELLFPEETKEKNSQNGDSRTSIFRYLRLNHLIDQLLNKVDESELSIKMGVELSYLDILAQEEVFSYFFVDKTERLSLDICKKIKQEAKKMPINRDTIDIIIGKMKKKKSTSRDFKIKVKDIEELTNITFSTDKEARDYIIKCIKFYEEQVGE